MKLIHILPSKINLPLIEAYIVGIFLVMAGFSFLIPNRMPKWAKHLLTFWFVSLGLFYVSIDVMGISELVKSTFIRIILGFTALSILIMNVGFAISIHYQKEANKLRGYRRRRDDIT